MLRASESAKDLWAKAAELERDFAGYKRRLAERTAPRAVVAVAAGNGGTGRGGADDEERLSAGEGTGRGRRYEEYVRRRDERLRQEWRARMERKEAEMKALWARLDRATSSRGRRGGDAELPSYASHDRNQDYVSPKQKPGSLEVKVKPIAPVTPRCSPATKTARPRTSVPSSSPATASPRLSIPTPRRQSSHLHRHLPQAEPPATPRKENRLPPPSSTAAPTAAPATPRPRTTMSRSRSMIKDRSCTTGRESPRPPRFQPPRTSCDGAGSNIREAPPLLPVQSRPCFSEDAAVLARLKQACAVVAPEPFHFGSSRNGTRPSSSLLAMTPDTDGPDCSETAPASHNAGSKSDSNGGVDRSATDKSASPDDITGDSDTEPSYVLVKRDSGEQTPRLSQSPAAGPGTPCPQAQLRPEPEADNGIISFEATTASPEANTTVAGESPMMADAEAASRRASSESLYSNVRSSFSHSQRSAELDASAASSPLRSPPSSCTTPHADDPSPVHGDAARPGKNPEEEEEEEEEENQAGSSVTVSITVQSPMDAMAGLKRFLSFGKKNGKAAGEVAATVVDRTPRAQLAPDGGRSTSRPSTGNAVKGRTGSSDVAASDDLDDSFVISPHARSLQSSTPSSTANPEMKEAVLHAKSPRVHRSFFSLSSFKSRAS